LNPINDDKLINKYKNMMIDVIKKNDPPKELLLNYFGSAREVESASFDDLKKVEGIETSEAQKIHDFFHN